MKSAMAVQCLPLNSGTKDEVYARVDRVIQRIRLSGLPFRVGPFETTVEGPAEELWILAADLHRILVEDGCPGATYLKMFSAEDLGSTEEKLAPYA